MLKKIVLGIVIVSMFTLISGCATTSSSISEEEKALEDMRLSFENEDFDMVKALYEVYFTGYHGQNSPQLIEAEELYDKALEMRLAIRNNTKPIERLKKTHDDISGITWYEQSYFTHSNNRNFVSLYIGEKEDNVWLRLKVSRYGQNWIFFEKCYLSSEENTYEVSFNQYEDKKTDSDTKTWEWIDVTVNDDFLEYLKFYAYSKNQKVRLSGKYSDTRELSMDEILGIQDVLESYSQLLGK